MGRSVSDAAAQAVAKSNKKESAERSPAQIISDARNHAQSGLAVTSADILFILSVLDSNRSAAIQSGSQVVELQEVNTILNENVAQLTAQVAEFRRVYELENRSSSVKIQKLDESEVVKAETTAGNTGGDVAEDILVAGVVGALNASTSGE